MSAAPEFRRLARALGFVLFASWLVLFLAGCRVGAALRDRALAREQAALGHRLDSLESVAHQLLRSDATLCTALLPESRP